MIENNNPEIDVDELMQKIREEVARRNPHFQLSSSSVELTSINLRINHIEALINNAESRAYTRSKWPERLNRFPFNFSKGIQNLALKVLNFLFKDQREVNLNIINSLKESLLLNRQLSSEMAILRSHLETLETKLADHINIVNSQFQETDERLMAVNSRVEGMDKYLAAIDSQVENVREENQHIDIVDSRVQELDEKLNAIDPRIDSWMNEEKERWNLLGKQLQEIDARHIRNDSYVKNNITQYNRLLTLFLEEARQRLPTFEPAKLQKIVEEDRHLLDALYVAFEDRFRGTQEDILGRLKVYLPLIEEAKIGTLETPIIDVGCGRGEWLELLKDFGYNAKGIDINRVMLDQCRMKALEVEELDALAYLQSLPDASAGAVTGFHIIEHLPFTVLIKFLNEVARVLKSGGLAIFETPNPKNLVVGACNFYSDPTHHNPIFPETIQFLLQFQGLLEVRLLYLNPVENDFFNRENSKEDTLHNWFFGPRDYAVIGYK